MKRWFMALSMAGALAFAPAMIPADVCPVAAAATAPDAALTRFDSGEVTSISALFSDRPLYINFWASWCPPCIAEMPHIDALYRQYGERMNFACVSIGDTEADARAYIAKAGLSVPVYSGDDTILSNAYDIQAIPISLLVAPGGEILDTHIGGMSVTQLEAFLKRAF